MDDPITRVFTVLEILQGRDRVSGAQLAARLQVDLRTVQRYIVRLKHLGIPIGSSPGVGGAYRLRPGFRMPPMLLTNEEAFALSLGLRALRQIGLATFAPATEGAMAKLARVLPESLRESIRTVEDVISFQPGSWTAPASVHSLIGVATAIRASQRIRFCYQSHRDETSTREVEPYAVLHADGRWYLIGQCLTRKTMRTFRLDRVTLLESCQQTFQLPQDFDARHYLQQHMPFIESDHQIDVWIDMTPEEASQSFALWRVAVEPDSTGVRLRCGRDHLDMFAAMLLSTGRRMIVHHPPELRDTFRILSARALEVANNESSQIERPGASPAF